MDSAPRASATDSANATNGNGRRGLIDLARVAVEDTVRLVQQEIQLAKIEIKEMLRSRWSFRLTRWSPGSKRCCS